MSIPAVEVAEFRERARAQAADFPPALTDLSYGTFETIALHQAPVTDLMLYRPAGVAAPHPVYVNLHGGGFVLGHWEADDPYCRLLADQAGCAVVNMDYVLAPEHPFPGAVEQVHALLVWLTEHGAGYGLDATRMVIGGHSAGGNLSAAVCLLNAERGGVALRGQILDYPPMDLVTSPSAKPNPDPSIPPELLAFLLASAEKFDNWYVPDAAERSNPLVSPVCATDLTGLPPALVITAELDILRAEADRYAKMLEQAGVPTEHVMFTGCQHGFTHIGPPDQAREAWRRIADFLRRHLA
ncbi:MAG: alpha/beta hydrolase [Actinobacteria bacterium]|nr:alpha/beta hydrolase [Actinomycetota bacterium]